jgi:AhpD family alkylhydroperoxidase
MRLAPIEEPRSLLLRIGYWLCRRQIGAVITPFKVIYARAPALGLVAAHISRVLEKGLRVEPELRLLVATQSSLLNGCGFCADLHRAQAVQARLGLEKFTALADFATSPLFSTRERAILAYTGEVTRRHTASDETFAELARHCDEREIVEITWLNAASNYFNLLSVPLGIESDGLLELTLRHPRGSGR